ncbi:hypothetical protein FNL56_13350 [Tardiphaga sp. vice304]|uniref:hypothetical protein n=1 Tax=Tardiphaga sp. vice304 TaxID=2592817 RepID=UPI001163AC4F|nr:hypothetical protein [Tardiphaga sp. vice304]QDM26986.1 hypothetical protein FNL56_13350 [Tardiphaga sp. vice304]
MSNNLEIKYDLSGLKAISARMRAASHQSPVAVRLAVKHTGGKATVAVRKALVGQTGLKRKVLDRAVKGRSVAAGYEIKSRGGNISLKHFGARETRNGVSAAPWGSRRIYPGTFIKGGKFPSRVTLKMNGQVFERTGGRRFPIRKVKSGLFIPVEMVKGQSEAAFFAVVERDLPARLEHELARILGG